MSKSKPSHRRSTEKGSTKEPQAIEPQLLHTAKRISNAFVNGHTLYLFGNGGSATQASHFAAELMGGFTNHKRRALPAISLSSDVGVLTAIANDYGYGQVFLRQVKGLVNPGDVVIGITTSGNSTNVHRALIEAQIMQALAVVMTGNNPCAENWHYDITLQAPYSETARIQEEHERWLHQISAAIEAELFPGGEHESAHHVRLR